MIYIGVDIETTGLDYNKDHRTIQLGLAFLNGDTWVYGITPMGVMTIDPEALAVNKFTLSRIEGGIPNDELDVDLYNHFSKQYKIGELTPVGWNVGSFDIGFLKKDLPKFSTILSHRVVDLTGICMLSAFKKGVNWRDLKEEWHKVAELHLGEEAQWHDALWDAKAAIKVWELLCEGDLS